MQCLYMDCRQENERRKAMDNYRGIVQNVVFVGEGEYRVTFRAYDDNRAEAPIDNNDTDDLSTLYSMIAKVGDQDCTFVGEGELGDCLTVFENNESVESVDEADKEKWKIGVLANDIASSLTDMEMLVPVGVEEE